MMGPGFAAGALFLCQKRKASLDVHNVKWHFTFMAIKSFRSTPLRAFFEDGTTRRLAVQNTARLGRILAALDAATRPSDMNLPGYRFHSLAPGQPGRYAVDATANYRVTFAWDAGAIDVDLEDYH